MGGKILTAVLSGGGAIKYLKGQEVNTGAHKADHCVRKAVALVKEQPNAESLPPMTESQMVDLIKITEKHYTNSEPIHATINATCHYSEVVCDIIIKTVSGGG